MRVGADAEPAAGVEIFAETEQAVAEVGLGGRAQPGDRAGGGQAARLLLGHVRGVHETPARIHLRVIEQPLHRPRVAHRQRVLHFAELLGDVDVDRPLAGDLRRQHLVQRGLGHRAQRMQGDADAQHRAFQLAQAFDQREERVDRMAEAALPLRQRAAVEAAGHVQRRQQGEADAGLARGLDERQRHRLGRRVGAAVGAVVQVVELAHLRVAGLEHLRVELRGDRAQLVGADAAGEGVHGLAPTPEAVVVAAAALGQPGHRALEGVRMQVGHARQHEAAERGAVGVRASGFDAGEAAVGDFEARVGGPAGRQPGVLGAVDGVGHAGLRWRCRAG
uniref:Uncharacterized protein n=1 Tax=Mizugakiibacter sediminis TaxID=1475481 RepID=A0A0S6YZH3_9GAMM